MELVLAGVVGGAFTFFNTKSSKKVVPVSIRKQRTLGLNINQLDYDVIDLNTIYNKYSIPPYIQHNLYDKVFEYAPFKSEFEMLNSLKKYITRSKNQFHLYMSKNDFVLSDALLNHMYLQLLNPHFLFRLKSAQQDKDTVKELCVQDNMQQHEEQRHITQSYMKTMAKIIDHFHLRNSQSIPWDKAPTGIIQTVRKVIE